jgi:tetratricopeptide (TPR) repeat protein
MESEFTKKKALWLWQEGQKYHESGDLPRAIALYSQSINLYPTAESYTFRGWAYSFQGRIEDAISECKKAIAVDPSFGNAYNDIGSYLIAQGKIEEAEGWLQKAKGASRYDLKHLPYMNLGRIYAVKGLLVQAIKEFEQALEYSPGESTCVAALSYLQRALH